MVINKEAYQTLKSELDAKNISLVAVSKTKPVVEIKELYDLGHRDFAENYVKELAVKQSQLPADIHWHFIGHLQSNKVKNIASFIHLIQSVDSFKLLKEINKQGEKQHRVIDCLLQVHIAQEETKFGMDEKELKEVSDALKVSDVFANVRICGLMGMASFTDDMNKVRSEFRYLKTLFDKRSQFPPASGGTRFTTLSMGMSNDYTIAIEEGSTMVRIGSLLFGERIKNQ